MVCMNEKTQGTLISEWMRFLKYIENILFYTKIKYIYVFKKSLKLINPSTK